jgi:hypothetical protein
LGDLRAGFAKDLVKDFVADFVEDFVGDVVEDCAKIFVQGSSGTVLLGCPEAIRSS